MASVKHELIIEAKVKGDVAKQLDHATGRVRALEAQATRSSRKMASGWKIAAASIAAIGGAQIIGKALRGMKALTTESITLASEAREMDSRFNVVFGNAEKGARAFADTLSKKTGRGLLDTKTALAAFQAQFKALEFSEDTAAGLSKTLVQLGIDLSSFSDMDQEGAFQAISRGLSGSLEATDKLNLFLREKGLKDAATRLGIDAGSGQLGQKERALAFVTEASRVAGNFGAIGDAERTRDSFSNRVKELEGAITDAKARIGGEFVDSIEDAIEEFGGWNVAIHAATSSVDAFGKITGSVAGGLTKSFGWIFKAGGAAANNMDRAAQEKFRMERLRAAGVVGVPPVGAPSALDLLLQSTGPARSFISGGGDPRFLGQTPGPSNAISAEAIASSFANGRNAVNNSALAAFFSGGGGASGQGANVVPSLESSYSHRLSGAVSGGLGELKGPSAGQAGDVSGSAFALNLAKDALEAVKAMKALNDEKERLLSQATNDAYRDSFGAVLSDIATGAIKAENALEAMGKAMLQIFADVAMRQVATAIFSGVGIDVSGAANGGVFSGGVGGSIPFKAFASGGVVDRPHLGLIGEGDMNEAVVPLPDGRSIPVQMQGGGGGGTTIIVNAIDTQSISDVFRRHGEEIVQIVSDRATNAPIVGASFGVASGGGFAPL